MIRGMGTGSADAVGVANVDDAQASAEAAARVELERPPLVARSSAEQRLTELWESEPGLRGILGSVDHKTIGARYLGTAFVFLVVGGIEALVMRLQLARSDTHLLGPEAYDQLFTMHGMTMIFWYASPILSGFANYLIPLMVGSRDMALPRLNAFSYWTFLLSGLLLYGSLLVGQAPHAGWFAYAPYTSLRYSPGHGMDFYATSLVFLTISTTAGAINFIVTIFEHRAPGMTMNRMPLFLYSTMTTSFTIVFSLPALTAACLFLELDRRWHFHFFDPEHGGSALLWQHSFWFFGHPWVYVIFLPATGMISMIVPVFSRRPIVAYPYVAAATVLTGVVGFGVWVHHMFATGMSHVSMTLFSAASMTISIFSAVQVFAWVATIWKGRPVLSTAMLFALGFIASLVLGGLSGVVTAVIPFDWQITDTYFVVAHLHYVLIGANVFPVFAGFYYWLPKMCGRRLDESLGRWSFAWMFVGFNVAFFPMHITGLLGMRRRVFSYAAGEGWDALNLVETIGAFILAVGILMSLYNFLVSLSRGALAGKNPWNADTLEWDTDSPPRPYEIVHFPLVRSRHPLWDPRTVSSEDGDPSGERIFDDGRVTLSTTWLDAVPRALAKMPEDTGAPLAASITIAAFFIAVLGRSMVALLIAAGATLIVAAVWLWPEAEKKPSTPLEPGERRTPLLSSVDQSRGLMAMSLFVATEASLFAVLFFAYFYLEPYTPRPVHLAFVIPMTAALVTSSGVLQWGTRRHERGEIVKGRAALFGTILLGVAFLILQGFEYGNRLRELKPQTNAYGSIFYTLTTIHGIHVLVGLLMLAYVFCLPRSGATPKPPHRAFRAASMYWHFVDTVWVFIFCIVYLAPKFGILP